MKLSETLICVQKTEEHKHASRHLIFLYVYCCSTTVCWFHRITTVLYAKNWQGKSNDEEARQSNLRLMLIDWLVPSAPDCLPPPPTCTKRWWNYRWVTQHHGRQESNMGANLTQFDFVFNTSPLWFQAQSIYIKICKFYFTMPLGCMWIHSPVGKKCDLYT